MTDLTKLSDEDLIEKIKLNLIDYISHQSFYKEDHEEELKARLASLREYEAFYQDDLEALAARDYTLCPKCQSNIKASVEELCKT